MAQIFISHSAKDKYMVDFFSNAFAGTKVKAVFEEFEKILTGEIKPSKIISDIEHSNAIFILLSSNVDSIPHTRDWVVWESGVSKNKDIWVFELFSQLGQISVVTPVLKHYVLFDQNDSHLGYISRIIQSYDDSNVLPTLLVTTGIGALLGKGTGASIGALAGLAISGKSKGRPTGRQIKCSKCSSIYNIHIPEGNKVSRCPVCNTFLQISE